MKKKYLSSITLFILAGLILLSYTVLKVIPFLGTYLGPDRIGYCLFITGAAVIGFIFFWLGRYKKPVKFLKYLLYLISFILVIGFPIAVLVGNAKSFRGFGWALETLLMGLVPVLILICGFLIWSGQKKVALLFSVIFGLLALFHLTEVIGIIPRLGRAFQTAGTSDLFINLGILMFAGVCSWINFSYFRSKEL